MFDPANDTSYHSLSPDDVDTTDSQVSYLYNLICTFSNQRHYTGTSIKVGTRKCCTASKQ